MSRNLKEARVWINYEQESVDPLGFALEKEIPPAEMASFIKGCKEAHDIAVGKRPDVIVMPERGAGPIMWTMQTIDKNNGDRHFHNDCCYLNLPLGTRTDIMTGAKRSLTVPEKELVISTHFDRVIERRGEVKKVLIIDEVQSGGTLGKTTRLTMKYLKHKSPQTEISILAMQDTRNKWLTHKKAGGWRTLVTNEREGVSASQVYLPLFSTDRQEFLSQILYPSDAPKETRAGMQMILVNEAAKNFFELLALGLVKRDEVLTTIEDIASGKESDQVPSNIKRLLNGNVFTGSEGDIQKRLGYYLDYLKKLDAGN